METIHPLGSHLRRAFPSEQTATALLVLGDGLTQQHELDPEAIDQGTFEMVLALLSRGMQPAGP